MRPILTLAIALYWLAHFALGAIEAGQSPVPGWAALMATGHAVAATCFLWLAMDCALGGEEVEDVAALAAGAGVLLIAITAGIASLVGTIPAPDGAAAGIAALAASYAAIRLECARHAERADGEDCSPRVARQMAAGAAHGSMLSRIARPTPETAET